MRDSHPNPRTTHASYPDPHLQAGLPGYFSNTHALEEADGITSVMICYEANSDRIRRGPPSKLVVPDDKAGCVAKGSLARHGRLESIS